MASFQKSFDELLTALEAKAAELRGVTLEGSRPRRRRRAGPAARSRSSTRTATSASPASCSAPPSGCSTDRPDPLDLKIAAAAMTEMREAFAVFAPYRDIPKVTVFGSARTQTHDPLYDQATRIAATLAERGWMVVTGAGPGIMQAAMEGAGRARSIGVAIRLPFEQGANPVIAGDEKYVSMKYFFTRKLMLVKESRAFVCLPGGFGTLDETFELLTLTQTGKGLPVPIVLLDPPEDPFWERIDEMIREQLVARVVWSPRATRGLYLVTASCDEAAAEIDRFYANYHSIRYVGDFAIVRLQRWPTDAQLADLNERFAHLVARGRIERSAPLDIERRHDDHVELPRIRFAFRKHRSGDLRSLIDVLNGYVGEPRVVVELTQQDDRLLDGAARLGERAVGGRPCRRPVGQRLLEDVEGQLVELVGDRLEALGEVLGGRLHGKWPPRRCRRGGGRRGRRPPGAWRTPGWRWPPPWRRSGAAARSMAPTLRVADVAGQRRLQHGVGAAGAAAQPVVVELDDVGDAVEHGAHRLVRPLHVAEVARVLHDHGRAAGALDERQAVEPRRQPLVDVDHPRRERARRRPCRGGARSPSSPPRTRPS